MGKKYSDNKNYKVIAFVHARFALEDQQVLIKTVTKKCKEHNCKAVFFSTLTNFYKTDLDAGELKIFEIIPVEKFDAIVLMAETFKSDAGQKEFVQRAEMAGVPIIAVDHYVPGCINISFDYEKAFREVVTHMVEYHGYRNIKFMAGFPNNSFSDERINVFKKVMNKNNIPFDSKDVYYGHFWEEPTVRAMNQMLEENTELPEAIICANDTMALTVCSYLRKHGFRVPEDVAVSGFDGVEVGKYHQPQLLTSIYDSSYFVDTLLRFINDGNFDGEKKRLVSVYTMQIGGSCGCQGVDALDAAEKIIKIQSDMNEQMEYQINLGRMVANYGEGEGMEIIQNVIPDMIKYMHYRDFWLCSEKRILIADYQNYTEERKKYSGEYNAIYFRKEDKSVAINYIEHTAKEFVVPDVEAYLEEEYPLLVVAVPLQEDPNAYAVISMETENFWYTAYSGFVFHLRFLLDMQRSKKRLMQVYRTDVLTGVLNRNGFYAMMNQVMEFSKVPELTVISIDMCRFKEINDTFGHAEGDVALQKVGEIIRTSVSKRDIAARTGGDEFVIILFRGNQKQRAQEIISSINEKAEAFNAVNPKDYKLIFSIGVCSGTVENKSLDYFLREADQKMYAHKKEQKLDRQ